MAAPTASCFQCNAALNVQDEVIFCTGNCASVRHKVCKGSKSPEKDKKLKCFICREEKSDNYEACLARARFLGDIVRTYHLLLYDERERAKHLTKQVSQLSKKIEEMQHASSDFSPRRKRSKSREIENLPKSKDYSSKEQVAKPSSGDAINNLNVPSFQPKTSTPIRKPYPTTETMISQSDKKNPPDSSVKSDKSATCKTQENTANSGGTFTQKVSGNKDTGNVSSHKTQAKAVVGKKKPSLRGTADSDESSELIRPPSNGARRKNRRRQSPALFLFGLDITTSAINLMEWYRRKGIHPRRVSKLKLKRREAAFCVSFAPQDFEKCMALDLYPSYVHFNKWYGPFPEADKVLETAPQ